jgi:sugar (pentulose or hexulose) kinase
MMWMRDHHPGVVGAARRVGGAKEFLGAWLTGTFAVDFSNGPSLAGWPDLYLELAGLPPQVLPPIRSPLTVLGSLRAEVADQLGLAATTPVILGASDGACANLGVGASVPGAACLSLSTTGVVRLAGATAPDQRTLAGIGGFAWLLEAQLWLWGALVTTAGAALSWLHALLDRPGLSLEALAQEAESVEAGSNGLTFRPYLQGMQAPAYRPWLTGSFDGLTLAHRSPHLARAVMEGVAYSVRAVVDALTQVGATISRWALTGGSAQSAVWRQIVADVLGVELSYQRGGTLLGAAMLAACGCGIYPDLGQAQHAMLEPGSRVVPGAAMPVYQTLYEAFCETAVLQGRRGNATAG